MEVVERIDEVDEGSSEAIDAHDDERVSASQAAVTLGPFRAFHGGSAGVFDVDGVASGGAKGLDLGGWILVCCADSRVPSDAHGHNRIGLVVAMSLFWPGFLDCCSGEYVVFPAHMARIGRLWPPWRLRTGNACTGFARPGAVHAAFAVLAVQGYR